MAMLLKTTFCWNSSRELIFLQKILNPSNFLVGFAPYHIQTNKQTNKASKQAEFIHTVQQNNPVSQSCAVPKSDTFLQSTTQSNMVDRRLHTQNLTIIHVMLILSEPATLKDMISRMLLSGLLEGVGTGSTTQNKKIWLIIVIINRNDSLYDHL